MQTKNLSLSGVQRWVGMAVIAVAASSALALWSTLPTAPASASTLAPVKPATPANPVPGTFADLIDSVSPAVVNISVSGPLQGPDGQQEIPLPPGLDEFFRHFFFEPNSEGPDAPPLRREAMGSGFVVDPEGYVVTNHHVIDHADEVKVTLNDGTQYDAKVLGADPKTDLALVKVDADRPLAYVAFADSQKVRVGDWVVAIGNPFGLGGTATVGIVSARGRDIRSGPYDDYLQIDAPINRGNSGGPLFDVSGEVIGINTAIFSPNGGNVGIGFAIPSDQAQPILQDLRDKGHVDRAWLGVQIQEVDQEVAAGLGMDKAAGALVADVTPDSPAAKAGVKAGDVITAFNGEPVEGVKELARMVAAAPADHNARLEVWRDGRQESLRASLERLPEDTAVASTGAGEQPPSGRLGLALASLTPEARRRFQIPDDVEGALVTRVAPDGPAARRGLRPGDVVVMVGQARVDGPSEAARQIEKATSNGRDTVLLEVARGGDLRFVPVRLS